MTPPHIGLIISSTRDGRFADQPAQWLLELAKSRTDASYELVDLRDYPLPFFNEPKPPMAAPSKNEVAVRWTKKLAQLDGVVFIVAEYNHGIPAVLKNAIDFVAHELERKPASFVAYGGVGGARAVEQLRLILVELQVAPLRAAVHLGRPELSDIRQQGKTLADFPKLAESAQTMLNDLVWWTKALMEARAQAPR